MELAVTFTSQYWKIHMPQPPNPSLPTHYLPKVNRHLATILLRL